ncbi:MAG: hypothetical protein NT123_22555 [Proteobacteria bacterium]|nr:hypothetical protein [Pseudomonadota bacterium]
MRGRKPLRVILATQNSMLHARARRTGPVRRTAQFGVLRQRLALVDGGVETRFALKGECRSARHFPREANFNSLL